MAQLFRPSANTIAKVSLAAVVLLVFSRMLSRQKPEPVPVYEVVSAGDQG